MSKTLIRQMQTHLIGLGYRLPQFGADGDFGQETYQTVMKALDDLAAHRKSPKPPLLIQALPPEWLPRINVKRIHIHWTAGGYKAGPEDRNAYHVIVQGDGSYVRGVHSIAGNVPPLTPKTYAAHTNNANSYAAGISMACMAGAKEKPFDAGDYPMTEVQLESTCRATAQMALFYGLAVQDTVVLTHAEVEPNLGIKQKGKWDITRIPFKPELVGAKACGDYIRSRVNAYIREEAK